MLSAALDKANAQNAEQVEQFERERSRNKELLTPPNRDPQPQQPESEKKAENESNLLVRGGTVKSSSI